MISAHVTQEWKWKPELGRWRLMEHGFPADPVRIAISTAGVAERDAYDYWRSLAFSDFEPDPSSPESRREFRARASGLCWERTDFFVTESGGVSGGREKRHIDRDGLDSLSIGLVLNGERRSEQAGDRPVTTGAGGLFVYDAARPGRVEWTRHKGIYLVVRRPDAKAVLDEIPASAVMMRQLAQSPMRHVLTDQFRMLARHMNFLSSNEQAYLLDQTIQLVLFALASPNGERASPPPPDAMLFHAALRYIELNLADPNLDAERVARAMNCSRATLYRAFAAEETGVAEAIRDIRLDRARILIEQMPPDQSIGDVAVNCGLYDTANFSRQFRRRFGVAPSDLRPVNRPF